MLVWGLTCFAQPSNMEQVRSLAPFVPSPQPIVERMLSAANLKPGETLFDLGCGDGRVLITAAKKFGAKAVGIELSPKLVEAANEEIKANHLEDQVKVIQGDLMETDLSSADVVTIYLLTHSNDKLRPNLERYLKRGARVVSHDFQVRGWKPIRVDKLEVYRRTHSIYVYEMPVER
ncbi:MAG: class I SAM-dependent methyltransferase [Acidobacteriales bacterium]|nr:class I SAM-dependent methyltransferase [Terriglobales bacterium]